MLTNKNEVQIKPTKGYVTKNEPLESAEETRIEDRFNENVRENRSRTKSRSEKRHRTTTSTTPFSDFIDDQESSTISADYEPATRASSRAPPIETTTPLQISADKFEITINQDLFNPNKSNKKDDIIIEHHQWNYHPKATVVPKEDPSRRENRPPNNSSDNHKKEANQQGNQQANPQGNQQDQQGRNYYAKEYPNDKSNGAPTFKPMKNLKTPPTREPSNQFEPLDSESKLSDQENRLKEGDHRPAYSTSIVIDGLPGFPDPSLYLDKSESTVMPRAMVKNKTERPEVDGRNIELAADGAGFVVDNVEGNFEPISGPLNRESSNREMQSSPREPTGNQANSKQFKPIKEVIRVPKDRFIVKDPSVLWATESDESSSSSEEQQDLGAKPNKVNKPAPPAFFKRKQMDSSGFSQPHGNSRPPFKLGIRPPPLSNPNLNSPSIKFVESVAESSQMNNKMLLLPLNKGNMMMAPKFGVQPNANGRLNERLNERLSERFNERLYNPAFRLAARRKREVSGEENKRTDGRIYRIFSFNQPTNGKPSDLDSSSNVNVERNNKPLKTSNYNYNNLYNNNLYNPNDDKVKVKDERVDEIVTDKPQQQQIPKKVAKPKKRVNPKPPVRQPNFLEDNPFINLFNTLTNIGQNSLNQAIGRSSGPTANANYQRAANEDESSDDEELDGNQVSTAKPKQKYGILGSGNYEVINGGIYKDPAKPKNGQPQQAFSTSDYSKENSKENAGQNNSNLNNFTPFSFSDIPLLGGFQGFDNFSKASQLSERTIKNN